MSNMGVVASAIASVLLDLDFASKPKIKDGSIPYPFDPGPVPNDFGPVVDSTKESKRARRRRLAREKGGVDVG